MDITTNKKVLVLASTFPRWKGDSEPAFIEYLSLQLAQYHRIHVLVPHAEGAKSRELWQGEDRIEQKPSPTIEIFRFRYFFTAGQTLAYSGGILTNLSRHPIKYGLVPFFMLSQLFSIARLQRRHQYDVIHAHWIIPQGFLAILFNLLKPWGKQPRVIITSHGGDLFALNKGILNQLKRWTLDRADLITVVSKTMKKRCTELGIDPNKIIVRSMGVDLKHRFTPGESEWLQRRGIVFVGRLVEKKGIKYLIQAMSNVLQRHPETCLLIIGDGPQRPSLEALAKSLHLDDRVTFLGRVCNIDIPPLLRGSRIAVIPSVVAKSGDQEGLGLTAVEAMGCGCAVVASDLPAIHDVIIDEKTGLLARPEDEIDLADRITLLLDDSAKLERLANDGRRFALDHFDSKLVGRDYAELIEAI